MNHGMQMNKSGILLDTHVWIWLVQGIQLSQDTQHYISKAVLESRLFVSAISLWEVSMLAAKDRIHIDRRCQEWSVDIIPFSGICG